MMSVRARITLLFAACLVFLLSGYGASVAISASAAVQMPIKAQQSHETGGMGTARLGGDPPSPSGRTGFTFSLYLPLLALLTQDFPPPPHYPFLTWDVGTGDIGTGASYYNANADVIMDSTGTICSGPKCKLGGWKTANGFDTGSDTSAIYYNAGDLGLGRDMHCKRNPADTKLIACYVTNYGANFPPAANPDAALENAISHNAPIATVAMEYEPTSDNTGVRFYVYLHSGNDNSTDDDVLVPTAVLDSEGVKNVPQLCMSCHGGNIAGNTVVSATFLPFDITSFKYDNRLFSIPIATTTLELPLYSLASQQESFRKLNSLVKATNPNNDNINKPIHNFIHDLYKPCDTGGMDGVDIPGCKSPYSPDNPLPAPQGWHTDPKLYTLVVAPYCRTCHLAQESDIDWTDYEKFMDADIMPFVCQDGGEGHRMPNAEVPYKQFWSSKGAAAREFLAKAFDKSSHCTY